MPQTTMTAHHRLVLATLFVLALLSLSACGSADTTGETAAENDQALQILATTNIVGDVVRNIVGDHGQVEVLLPPGSDPHGFDPTPQDVAKIAEADLIFANGAGLEEGFLDRLIENAAPDTPVIQVSEGLVLLEGSAEAESEAHAGEEQAGDPHTWTDPNNVRTWVENILFGLAEVDPEHQADYQEAAAGYIRQLEELDEWIQEQVEAIPPEERRIVTDHTLFTYFANEYGFDQVGAIVPGYSTLAEPSAQELARLEDAIRQYNVDAILVGNTVNPSVAERIAEDTGIRLVRVYTGSLSEAGGEAETYLEYMRYNVEAITGALR